MNRKQLSELLNMKCNNSDKLIEVGEFVEMHNWGAGTGVLGVGSFEYNESERRFEFHLKGGESYQGMDMVKPCYTKISEQRLSSEYSVYQKYSEYSSDLE
jgi:hypothetical protein